MPASATADAIPTKSTRSFPVHKSKIHATNIYRTFARSRHTIEIEQVALVLDSTSLARCPAPLPSMRRQINVCLVASAHLASKRICWSPEGRLPRFAAGIRVVAICSNIWNHYRHQHRVHHLILLSAPTELSRGRKSCLIYFASPLLASLKSSKIWLLLMAAL